MGVVTGWLRSPPHPNASGKAPTVLYTSLFHTTLTHVCIHRSKSLHVYLTGEQNNHVQERSADGLQPHRVPVSDSVGNAAEG